MKKILLCLVAIIITTSVSAQGENNRQRIRREFNPEETALRQTNALNEALQLDSTQYQYVFIMNYADALTMQDSINARRERMEKMKAEGKKIERSRPTDEEMKAQMEIYREREKIRDEQLKAILTPEQYEKYLKYKEEQSNRMRQRRGGRRGGAGRPGGPQGFPGGAARGE